MDTHTKAPHVANEFSIDELRLAARNHSMPLEALCYSCTPVGLHYLLIHYDIPQVDATTWRLTVHGAVAHELTLSLDELRALPSVTQQVTLECAGNGRGLLSPHVVSQPWLGEAVGTAEWTGTPLSAVLVQAGVDATAVEALFTGLDRGIDGGEEQDYARSLTLAEATRDEVLLAYAMDGAPLLPQHGFPVRLIVPGWYGMTHVKWLRSVTLLTEPFQGYQQSRAYRVRGTSEDAGTPVTRMKPRALMIPPGFPEYQTRIRHLRAGPCTLRGQAWSGWGAITRVEVSDDAGQTWRDASLGDAASAYAWRPWSFTWDATAGAHELCCRATDSAGNVQPLQATWNTGGYENNSVQRVSVVVA
jgi:sulfane dehydrogenase subunit SoxC